MPASLPEKNLVIFGASTSLLEVIELIHDINAVAPRFKVIGALDDNAALHGKEVAGVKVLGPLSQAAKMEKDIAFVFSIGAYANRLRRIDLLESLGIARERFVSLVHPSAKIYSTAKIGHGCIIYNGALIMAESRLGDFIIIFGNSVVAPSCKLDDFALLGSLVFVGSNCHIGSGAFLGSSSAIMEKTRIGPGAMVGLASAALRDVAPGATVLGNPVRIIENSAVPQHLVDAWECSPKA